MPTVRLVSLSSLLLVVSLSRGAFAEEPVQEEQVQIETTPASPSPASVPRADAVTTEPSEPSLPASSDAAKETKRANKKRTAGIILTSIGGAGVVGGAIFLAYGSAAGEFRGEFGGVGALLGLAPLVVGAAAVAVGIPLWVSGQNSLNRMGRERVALVPQLAVLPSGAAVGLGGVF